MTSNPTLTGSAYHINQRLSFAAILCTVRYIGPVEGTSGEWLGVEWDEPTKGKHSGEHGGKKYFDCIIPDAGSFIRPSRVADTPLSFIQALRKKYIDTGEDASVPKRPVEWGGKVVEEVGFDKIWDKLRKLKELKTILVDGSAIDRGDTPEEIAETCPNIQELDFSRNLFEKIETVEKIIRNLPKLRALRLSGNRWSSLALEGDGQSAFSKITTLELEETLLKWEDLAQLLPHLKSLQYLDLDLNRLTSVPPTIFQQPIASIFPNTLTKIKLEKNRFTSLSSLYPLATLPNLRHLLLAHNQISKIFEEGDEDVLGIIQNPPIIFTEIHFLDLSYNAIPSFTFIDAVNRIFPNVDSLRISHNPLYQTNGIGSDEGHMLTLGRLGWNVRALNFSNITIEERSNAELYYLSRIAKEVALVPEKQAMDVTKNHPRWAELCKLHGEPIVSRVSESEKKALGANLISLEFIHYDSTSKSIRKKIPKSTTISTLKGVAGRLFNEKPFRVQLEILSGGTSTEPMLLEDEFRRLEFYVEDKKEAKLMVKCA